LISVTAPFAARGGDRPVFALTVEEALRLPKGRIAIHAPVRLKQGDSLFFTTLQTTDLPARDAKILRGLQISIYAVDPNNPNSYGVHLQDLLVTSAPSAAAGGGGGAGKVSMNDISFAQVPDQYRFADGSVRLLALTIGYEVSTAEGAVPKPAPLPKDMILTAELNQGGVGLLLPAVQKVREAAAR
jgi:hypothetical protein